MHLFWKKKKRKTQKTHFRLGFLHCFFFLGWVFCANPSFYMINRLQILYLDQIFLLSEVKLSFFYVKKTFVVLRLLDHFSNFDWVHSFLLRLNLRNIFIIFWIKSVRKVFQINEKRRLCSVLVTPYDSSKTY